MSTTIQKPALKATDPEMWQLLQEEGHRQRDGLELVASENFASQAVFDALGSCFNNKYSEGYAGKRYYGGNSIIDKVETLCQTRALQLFGLKEDEWGVNVQPLSGSPANLAVYTALIQPHDRIMGLDLPDGGHLSHGFMTPTKRISATSIFYESMPYHLKKDGSDIDYDALESAALSFRPKVIVAGTSAFSRPLDYKRFRQICDKVGAFLLSDMAHVAGLVAAGVNEANPFEYSDVVTTTTHKTLRGPRGGMIFYRKGLKGQNKKGEDEFYDYEDKINWAVFPALQGGPHEHQIAAIAVALKEAMKPEFKDYQIQVKKNTAKFAEEMKSKGYKVVSDGTQNHLFLLDLSPKKIDGSRVEKVLDIVEITANKNTVPGDTKPLVPSGIRIGTPALTTRGFKEADIVQVATLVDRAIDLTKKLANKDPQNAKSLRAFNSALVEFEHDEEVVQLKKEVNALAGKFPMPFAQLE